MYRSVTFSEIFSSTFSDDLNKYDSHDRTVKTKFAAKIGIGLIEFMLSSIFLSYGIIFSDCVKSQYYTPEDGLWTTILYTAAWNIASPWSRHICNYFERNKYSLFRYIIAAAVAFLFIGLIIPNQFLSFGVFGGIFSNLIYTQLKFIAIEKFDMDSKVFEANVQVARALTLLMLPHFMLLLVSYYTIFQVKLIFAAFLLNIFPAALIIKPPRSKQKYTEISRYQTLPAFSNQMREMMSFVSSSNSPEPLKSESSTEDDDDDDDEKEIILPSIEHDAFYDNIIMNDQISHPTCLTPLTVETYYKNAGVSILPQILEENEIDNEIAASDSNKPHVVTTAIKEINTKSVIGEQNRRGSLEHYVYTDMSERLTQNEIDNPKEVFNVKDLQLVSKRLLEEPERIQNIEYIPNYTGNNKHFLKDFKVMKARYNCCCSPYRKFIWKRRFRSIADFVLDNVVNPCSVSFKDLHFYPTVVSKAVTNITSTVYITLAPYAASQRISNFLPEDTTFLLSYTAFSWCLFLVLLPLIINFSQRKIRTTFICGLLLTGISVTLVSRKISNDIITISCLLFGFGYGATNFTENMVYKSFIGKRKWTAIKGTLETTSALLVILIYYIIYYFNINLRLLVFLAFSSYYLNAILWIIMPIIKRTIFMLSRYCENSNEEDTIHF